MLSPPPNLPPSPSPLVVLWCCVQGFLPTDADAVIQDVVYPSYSPQLLLFLGLSSLYGLFKTGKLPGQSQSK